MKRALRGIRFVAGAALAAAPGATALLTLATVLAMPLSATFGVWLKLMADAAIRGAGAAVVATAVGLALTLGLQVSLRQAETVLGAEVSDRTKAGLERRLMAQTMGLPSTAHHEDPEHIDRLSLLRGEAAALPAAPGALVSCIGLVVTAAINVALLVSLHPLLLMVPVFGLPSLLIGGWTERRTHRLGLETAEDRRLEAHLFRTLTTAASFKEVRVAGAVDHLDARRRRAWAAVTRRSQSNDLVAATATSAGLAVFAAGYTGAFGFMVWRVLQGHGTPGDVVMASTLVFQLNYLAGTAVELLGQAAGAVRAAAHFLWLDDYVRAQPGSPAAAPVPGAVNAALVLEGVGFTYPGAARPALSGISLRVPRGAVVALVGENGAGKTTLAKLLCRFYEPTAGRILLDGIDVRDIPVEAWRTSLTATFQDFARFELTARQAVGVGHLDRVDDAPSVWQALFETASGATVAGLPAGVETQLGAAWPAGVDLSGGQWQGLAVARMAMRREPLLLILDEPTSNLDADAEQVQLHHYFDVARRAAAARGGITFITTHRLSSVAAADLVVVLHDGAVAEVGTHDELLARRGLYREQFELQAAAYR